MTPLGNGDDRVDDDRDVQWRRPLPWRGAGVEETPTPSPENMLVGLVTHTFEGCPKSFSCRVHKTDAGYPGQPDECWVRETFTRPRGT